MTTEPKLINGRYELGTVIGAGGMGNVYWANDHLLHRTVAFKVLREAEGQDALEQFNKECRALASLSHPNIVDIYDVGELEQDGRQQPYMVMPLLAGAALDRIIREDPSGLSVDRATDIAAQIALGLQAAHDRGVVHRDLKPTNIFVLPDDSVKIIDFGIAQLAGTATRGELKGTLAYMAPEQLTGGRASIQSDIHALGVICYEILAKSRPFAGESAVELVDAIVTAAPQPLTHLNPELPPELCGLVESALSKNPADRPASAAEFRRRLCLARRNRVDVRDGVCVSATSIQPSEEQAVGDSRVRRRAYPPTKWAGLAAALVLAGLLVGKAAVDGRASGTVQAKARVAKKLLSLILDIDPSFADVSIAGMELGRGRAVQLPEGEYELAATADGYEPLRQVIRIGQGESIGPLALVPLPTSLDLSVDYKSVVLVDGTTVPVVGDRASAKLSAGIHAVEIRQLGRSAKFEIEAVSGQPARVTLKSPFQLPVVVTSFGQERAFVFGAHRAGTGDPLLNVAPEGREIFGIRTGTALVVAYGADQVEVKATPGSAPSVVAVLIPRGVGTVQVTSSVPGAALSVDGRDMGVVGREGRSAHLLPGAHRFRLAKAGYASREAEVVVSRGRVTPLDLTLDPARFNFTVQGAEGEADLLIDGVHRGRTQAGKTLTVEVESGMRQVELRALHHRSLPPVKVSGGPDDRVNVTWRDLLIPMGYLELSGLPGASATCVAVRDSRAASVALGRNELPTGTYTCKDSLLTTSKVVEIRMGETAGMEIVAVPAVIPLAANLAPAASSLGPTASGMDGAYRQKRDGWVSIDRGGAVRLRSEVAGTYSFELARRRRLFGLGVRGEWVLRWSDGYEVRYVLGGNSLECWTRNHGRASRVSLTRVPEGDVSILIEVAGDTVRHRIGTTEIVQSASQLGRRTPEGPTAWLLGPTTVRNVSGQ